MKYFNLVMIVMVLMLSFSRLVWAGEQEEFKVWQIEKKIGEVQREWNEIVGKDKRLVELKARAEALRG